MPKPCKFFEKCDFIRGIDGVTDEAKRDFIEAYCSDERSAHLCIRRMSMDTTGNPPAVSSESAEPTQHRFSLA